MVEAMILFAVAWAVIGYVIHRRTNLMQLNKELEEMTAVLLEMDKMGALDHSPEGMEELNQLMKREFPNLMKDKDLKSIKPK